MKKILLLSVNPEGTHQLRLDEEFREIQEAFKRSKYREKFEIRMSLATRVSDLRRALLEYEPTIVHFSGHGSGNDGLVLENEFRQQQLVSSQSLAKLFKLFQTTVECVLLNACHSEAQAQGIYESIDCVITMKKAIGDRAAINFSLGFYDALGAGKPYQQCFEVGRASIDLEGIPESEIPKIRYRERAYSYAGQEEIYDKQEKTAGLTANQDCRVPEKSISQSMNFSGAKVSGGLIAQAGGDLKQTQQINNGGTEKSLTIAEVCALIKQIETLLITSDLPDNLKQKALTHLETAEEEIQDNEPNKDSATKGLKRVSKVIKEANETVGVGVGILQKLEPIFTKLAPWLGVTAKNLLLLP